MPDIENPMLSPKLTDDPFAQQIGKCHYRHCEEMIYEGQGYEAGGYIYCSTACIGEQGIEDRWVEDLAQI